MGNPDPDAQLVMSVLLASPNRDDPGALLSAARAYEAVRSARDRGAIPPLECARCGSSTAPLARSSKSAFKRYVCVSNSRCRKRREQQRRATNA